jgi:hypothetical protein
MSDWNGPRVFIREDVMGRPIFLDVLTRNGRKPLIAWRFAQEETHTIIPQEVCGRICLAVTAILAPFVGFTSGFESRSAFDQLPRLERW